MTPKQVDKEKEPAATRGMLMDESATPARHRLVALEELPPAESDEFDRRFALLDEREHGDVTKQADGRRRGSDTPISPDETAPPDQT
jgi:hypothetical protein